MVRRGSSGAQNGRQREIQRLESKNARQVCFSKRRNGLFKKASELATMCGAEVAILVNSPAGRPYTFGSPAVDPVIDRFLSNNPNEQDHSSSQLLGSVNNRNPHHNNTINHLNQQYNDLTSRLDAARFRRLMLEERLKQAAKETPVCTWYKILDELDLNKSKQLLEALYKAKDLLAARQNELICAGGASTSQIANYPNPLASTLMANATFPNQMLHQQEPRMIDCKPPSFNPSLGVGLNKNMTPVTGMSFDPRAFGKSCDYVVGSSSKSEERVPHSIGGFGLGSIRYVHSELHWYL